MNLKTCVSCNEKKPLEDFVLDKNKTDNRRNNCKPCHSANQSITYFNKMLDMRPLKYVTCDSCDRIMSIKTPRCKIIKCCKYCESTDLYNGHGEPYLNK